MERYESETQVYKCIWRSLVMAVLIIASTVGGCTALKIVRETDIKRLQLETDPQAEAKSHVRRNMYLENDRQDQRFQQLWLSANDRYIGGEFEHLVQVRQMQLLERAMRYRVYIQELQLLNRPNDSNEIQVSLPNRPEDVEKELERLRQGIDTLTAKRE